MFPFFYSLAVLCLVLGSWPIGQFANALPEGQLAVRDSSYSSFTWGAIGDSWASGVTYDIFGNTDYDGNYDECLRLNHAYSVQVSQDQSWLPVQGTGGVTQDFHFAACSGARLDNMGNEPYRGYVQMQAVGVSPSFVTMQAGGNNAGFAAIADACMFRYEWGLDYGADYPGDGECARRIQAAHDYIENPWWRSPFGGSLERDLQISLGQILGHPPVKPSNSFKHLYLIGYAHFFNTDDDNTWCDSASFGLGINGRPPLTLELRRALNDLVERLNRKLEKVAGYTKQVEYIDTSEGFGGNRFCEPGHSLYDQYFGTKVKLWNLSPEGVVFFAGSDYTAQARDPTQEEFDKWYATGRFTDDPTEVLNATVPAMSRSSCTPPCQDKFPGVALRPFHPKRDGHAVMAQAIVARLKTDFRGNP